MKKILFFTYDFPYPTNTGGKNRAYHLLKYAGEGVEFFLFSFVRKGTEYLYHQEKLQKIGVKNIQLFERKKVRDLRIIVKTLHPRDSIFKALYFDTRILNKLIQTIKLENIDIVHYESFYTAFYLSNSVRGLGVKQIFGTENIEHSIYRDYARYIATSLLKPLFYLESLKIEREEKNMFKLSDLCIAVTEQEAQYVRNMSGKECEVVENGVDPGFFSFNAPKKEKGDTILFVGNFSYFPNNDAVLFFYNNVFKKLDGNLRLIIVGKQVNKLLIRDGQRVERIDYIDDIREVYRRADVLVSPVRIGGGTNFKLLEAMAMGVPIIAHPNRLGSLHIKDGQHLLIAKNPDEFTEKINLLLNDQTLRIKLSRNARTLVEEKFDWEKIGKKLNTIWKNVAQ